MCRCLKLETLRKFLVPLQYVPLFFVSLSSSPLFFLVIDIKSLVRCALRHLLEKPTDEESGRETVLSHSALSESDGGREKKGPT